MLAPRFSVGENGFHKFVTESRRDGARTLCRKPITPMLSTIKSSLRVLINAEMK